ncbi:hypothetical protein EVAR_68275_1 [Eumeta japonica]|uniref:Secreted protein n=1 Tax=Eumeta variegata TaxID=151549 RepID=A0A4C1ZRU0_EUMVA|nr:hypothetical protein EVAR_68275_1 [Eumeta japonica]
MCSTLSALGPALFPLAVFQIVPVEFTQCKRQAYFRDHKVNHGAFHSAEVEERHTCNFPNKLVPPLLVFFLRRYPNAETLSRHEPPDCGAKRGITHAQ